MPDIEKKMVEWLEERKEILFFLSISCIGAAIRIGGRDFVSGGADIFLMPWYLGNDYEHLKSAAVLLTIGILGVGLLAFMESSVCIEDAGNFIQALIWSVWTCLLFLLPMHERYSYLLMILLILHACLDLRVFCYAVLEFLCSTASYGNYLYENQISLKILSFVYVLSYFSYTYQILKENNRGGAESDECPRLIAVFVQHAGG